MFRFTIREFILVMVSVSVAAAWWTDQRYLRAENRYLEYENTRLQREYEYVKAGRNEALAVLKKVHGVLQGRLEDDEDQDRAALKVIENGVREHADK